MIGNTSTSNFLNRALALVVITKFENVLYNVYRFAGNIFLQSGLRKGNVTLCFKYLKTPKYGIAYVRIACRDSLNAPRLCRLYFLKRSIHYQSILTRLNISISEPKPKLKKLMPTDIHMHIKEIHQTEKHILNKI